MATVVAPLQDDNGFVLQQCAFCGKYFKLQFGTGSNLPALYCPYCGRHWSHWFTDDHVNYFKGVAANQSETPLEPPDDAKLLEEIKVAQIFVNCGHGDIIQHDGTQGYLHCVVCGCIHEQTSPGARNNKSRKTPKRRRR